MKKISFLIFLILQLSLYSQRQGLIDTLIVEHEESVLIDALINKDYACFDSVFNRCLEIDTLNYLLHDEKLHMLSVVSLDYDFIEKLQPFFDFHYVDDLGMSLIAHCYWSIITKYSGFQDENILDEGAQILRLLIDNGANPNFLGPNGDDEIYDFSDRASFLAMLISVGFDPNIPNEHGVSLFEKTLSNLFTPETVSVFGQEVPIEKNQFLELDKEMQIVSYLHSKGGKPDDYKSFLLFESIKKENVLLLKFLLKDDINLKIKNRFGTTPLEYAVEIGNKEIISLLK